MANYTVKQFKSILNIRKSPDYWFWEKYGINPYNGCEHGCIYCDSRSARYHLPTDFENDIIIKDNIKQMLESRLSKARSLLPDIVAMAGASDPYHAAETKYKNTLQCLEVLNKYHFPVHIITKSKLVERDLNIIDNIGKNTWSCISFTITTTDSKLARFIEPKAPSPQVRFDAIKKIKHTTSNIQTGVLLMPVIPFLGDTPWQLEELVKKAKDYGADYIVFGGGMTMRNIQALWFLKHLKKSFPTLLYKYEQLYQFSYTPGNYNGKYTTSTDYYRKINDLIYGFCNKYNMPVRIKRFIPEDYRKMNYIISEQLFFESYKLQLNNTPDKDIFWTAMNIQQLRESIVELYQSGNLKTIKNLNSEIEKKIVNEIQKRYDGLQQNKQLRLFK